MRPLSRTWMTEARALGRISLAVTVTMLAQLAMGAVETVLIAGLGTEVLAGVSLAQGLHLLVFLFALGVVTAVTPLAAAAYGRRDHQEACRIGRAGLVVGLAFAIPGTALLIALATSLKSILGDGFDTGSATAYLLGTAPGLPAWVSYVALRCLAVATSALRITTAVMLALVPVHAALAAWMVLGGAGLPPLGALGAGLAHAATGYLVLVLLAGVVRYRGGTVLSAVLSTWPSWHCRSCSMLLRLGLPFACRILLREGVMPVASLMLAPFGPAAVASHAVAARIADLLGVFTFGLSDAANARVGHALGAGRREEIGRSVRVALQPALLVGGVVAASVVLLPETTTAAILPHGSREEVGAVVSLLPAVAIFLFLETVMSAAGGALSGLRDGRGPLIIAVVGTWLVSLPLGVLLASTLAVPTLGLWTGLVIGTAVTATMLLLRLVRKLR